MIATLAQRHMPALARWWERSSRREHAMVISALVVVGGALGWLLLLQPMQADITRMQRDNARNHAVLAAAQAQAADLATLARDTAPTATADARGAVERVIAERGLRPALTSIDLQDGRVRVLFNSVRFETLAAVLDALARNDGVRLVDAVLTTRVEAGTVRAELTLVRG
ncbi:MAG: type II secretion system protein GspM [Betaproteobacteria bacterium]